MYSVPTPVSGHSGRFRVWAVVNAAAADTGAHVSFSAHLPGIDAQPGVGLPGHTVALLVSKEPPYWPL